MHFPIFFWQENIGKYILMVVRVFHRILQSNTLVLSGCGPRHRLRMAHSSSCCGPRHRLRAHCSSSSSGCGPRHRHGSLVLILGLRPAPQAASSLAAARATGCELTLRPPPRAARPPAALRREAPCRSPTSACPARPATKSSATPRSRTLCPPSNLQ